MYPYYVPHHPYFNRLFRIDPILFETVVLTDDTEKLWTHTLKSESELFVANIGHKPPEFYSMHVKNLWILAPFSDLDEIGRILTICSGVQNLVLFTGTRLITGNLPFMNPGGHLRRMTVNLGNFSAPWFTGQGFEHACFANISHLHLYDKAEDWSMYTGFEHLCSLTHFALACCEAEQLAIVTPKLPALEYVALCSYSNLNRYARPMVNRRASAEMYDINVVWVQGLTTADWECGATGGTDFWDLVEKEVARRRAKVIRKSDTNRTVLTNSTNVEPRNPLELATFAG